MALTETYVDPSINANSGTGTIGDPYGDLQYALDTMTRDGTNGDRLNLKSGATETLTASLTLTTYGTPTATAPLVIQGYTTTAGDHGRGIIDGTTVSVFNSTAYDYVSLIDLDLTSSAVNSTLILDNYSTFINLTVANTGTGDAIQSDFYSIVINCEIDCAGTNADGINVDLNSQVLNNTIKMHTSTGQEGIVAGAQCTIKNNTIWTDSTTDKGITAASNCYIEGNSIYNSAAGTDYGIQLTSTTSATVLNNLVEGWSGAGGNGIRVLNSPVPFVAGNALYNCTTNIDYTGSTLQVHHYDNETLGASPFTDPSNGDFTPVDTGNVLGGSKPAYVGLETY